MRKSVDSAGYWQLLKNLINGDQPIRIAVELTLIIGLLHIAFDWTYSENYFARSGLMPGDAIVFFVGCSRRIAT